MLLPSLAFAEASVTAMAADGGRLYVALTQAEADYEPESALVEIDSSLAVSRIALPKDLLDRDLFALIPAGQRVLVLSQRTVEGGDAPKLSIYDKKTKKWIAPGTADCPAVARVKVEKSRIVLGCEDGATGEISERAIKLPKGVTLTPAEIALPQHMPKSEKIEATFDDAGVKIRSGERTERLTFERLLAK
jgi:hypothetical protein